MSLTAPGALLCPACHTRLPRHQPTCRRTVANQKGHRPMTDTTVIYRPDTWNVWTGDGFRADPRTPVLLEWLRANNINPEDMPQEQGIAIDTSEHGSVIRYLVHVRNGDGSKMAMGDAPVFEARTVPLTVDPPAELTARPAPAGPDLAAPVVPLPVQNPAELNGQAAT